LSYLLIRVIVIHGRKVINCNFNIEMTSHTRDEKKLDLYELC